jgi:hypothetical protein
LIVLRCTEKLRRRLRLPKLGDAPASTTALGDWFGNPVSTRHARVILLVSEKSRLPVLVPARNLDRFEQGFVAAVHDLLLDLGIPEEAADRERNAMSELVFARTNSRSVLGTMNDYTFGLRIMLEERPGMTLHEIALHLSETPLGPFGYKRPVELGRSLLQGSSAGAGLSAFFGRTFR